MDLMKGNQPKEAKLFIDYSFAYGENAERVVKCECSPDDGVEMIISDEKIKDQKIFDKVYLSWRDVKHFRRMFESVDQFYGNNYKFEYKE